MPTLEHIPDVKNCDHTPDTDRLFAQHRYLAERVSVGTLTVTEAIAILKAWGHPYVEWGEDMR